MPAENITALDIPDPFTARLRAAVKLSPHRAYRLARMAALHPTVLSAWINGIRTIPHADPRLAVLCEVLGIDEPATGGGITGRIAASQTEIDGARVSHHTNAPGMLDQGGMTPVRPMPEHPY